MVFRLGLQLTFPDPLLADEDGLLAVGGDLSIDRLIVAYQQGIFPWYSEGGPILWYSPHERFVIFADEIHLSRSMRALIKSDIYRVTWDQDFEGVISHCASIKRSGQLGTWINPDMIAAYIELFDKGVAHSVEVWQSDKLIGGVYGVEMGNIFCGESMFTIMPGASKLALIYICQSNKYKLIDCQLHTPHLESMGGRFISRNEYNRILNS
jgi:leucyl/phenylalanyl-tRNA--protein transferase